AMDKPIPEAVVGRAHLQAVLNLSEAARCLGVAQAKNDQGAIDYWTDKTNEYEAALTATQQQGQAAPPSAPVGGEDGINVPAARALIETLAPGFKVIYRSAFRW